MGGIGLQEIRQELPQLGSVDSVLAKLGQLKEHTSQNAEGDFPFYVVITTDPGSHQAVQGLATQHLTKNFTVKEDTLVGPVVNSDQAPESVTISSLKIYATLAKLDEIKSWVEQIFGNNVPVGSGLSDKAINSLLNKTVTALSTNPLEQLVMKLLESSAKYRATSLGVPLIAYQNPNNDEEIPEDALGEMVQEALTSLNPTPVDTSQILLASIEKINKIMIAIIKKISPADEEGITAVEQIEAFATNIVSLTLAKSPNQQGSETGGN